MPKNIHIEISEDQYEELSEFKDRERVHMERTLARRLPRPQHRQDDRVGQTAERHGCKYPANRTQFLPAVNGGVSSLLH